MKVKQPDHFARAVEKVFAKNGRIYVTDAVTLLQREHRAVVRIVKEKRLKAPTQTEEGHGFNMAIDNVLTALEKRRK